MGSMRHPLYYRWKNIILLSVTKLQAIVEDMCIGGINVDAALLGVELIN